MDHIWIFLIQSLFHISFLIGVSYFRRGRYLLFDGVVFCAALVWFGGCTIRLETDGLVFGAEYRSFHMCVIFWCLFMVNIVLFLTLIDFRLKNNRSFQLIALNGQLGIINWQIRSHRNIRRLLSTFGVIGFYLLNGMLFLYWEVKAFDLGEPKYNRLCAMTLPWPTTLLCFQFCCWIQIFTFNFELVLDKIRNSVACERTNVQWMADCKLSKLNDELKLVMRLKHAIVGSYGSSIVFNQLYTFLCLLLNCTLLTHVEYGRNRAGALNIWYRHYFVARILYYLALSYIPHWIGQIASSEVTELLHAIRKLLVTNHNVAFNEKMTNCLFNPVYDDLKFRVCDLFDLTNKQFVSFVSVSIGFVIIQVQLMMKYQF